MDIRKSKIHELAQNRKIPKKDVLLLEEIIEELTIFFNSNNSLVKKYKTGNTLFDEMDDQQQRELKIIFNENARPKHAHKRTYNKPSETEITVEYVIVQIMKYINIYF